MPINVDHLSYTYLAKTPNAVLALDDVSLSIDDHSFNAIIGETGSGKSTLIQNLNALIIPQKGTVMVDSFLITTKKRKNKEIKKLRKHIGLVFQFPEYQLFEETVLDDVAFGVKNFGFNEQEAKEKSKQALASVGISEEYYERSPFDLSGGEKRRVAIAGILAIDPDILVLDEPTAGLDPSGAQMIMDLLVRLYDSGKTIILVTHDMNLVLKYCQKAFVIHQSKKILEGKPYELFDCIDESMAIELPPLFKMAKKLKEKGFDISLENVHTVDDLVLQIKKGTKHD